MKIEVQVNEVCKEPKVVVMTNKMTDEISQLVQKLSDSRPQLLAGFNGRNVDILEEVAIIRIYASNQKVYAETSEGLYVVKYRLYELEEILDKRYFISISNSEIVNLRKVERLDLSQAGTICMKLCGDITTYVSRRHVLKVKHSLGI